MANNIVSQSPQVSSGVNRHSHKEQSLEFSLSVTNEGLKFFESVSLNDTRRIFSDTPPHEIFNIIKPKFKELFGESGALISYLVDQSHLLRWNLIQMSNHIAQLESQLAKIQSDK